MPKREKKTLQEWGILFSDRVSSFVGTWKFVGIYTLSMAIWIVLHLLKILDIDGPDFIKWNLWLSYFAGTQASIVLMSSVRQANKDRRKADKQFQVDKQTLSVSQATNKRVVELMSQIEMLEDIVDDLLEEKAKRIAESEKSED